MTPEQEKRIHELGLKIKEILFDFTGSVTYHLTPKINDVKYEVNKTGIIKKK